MTKYIFLLFPIFLFANSYIAKIEPKDEFSIYANASGEITYLDKNKEMNIINGVIVKIDNVLDKENLSLYQAQLKLLNEKLSILQDYYNKFKTIKGKSDFEKDEKYMEIIELKNSIKDLEISIANTKNTLSKKEIALDNLYLKEFVVNKYDYVNVGTKIATAYDISKAKLVIYLNSEDYKDIKSKQIYLDGKKSDVKIKKLDITPDKTFISAYKLELEIDSKEFGKSITVEFK
ncbi:hypothetical protein PJV89_08640 [Aliarcobacter butzleri]|uniref:HlyD family secretion protein n=2 Tax=Aliarcobacter butzleri TaxID=28197 RepID=A0AAW6VQ00_9BACT|nr:hypothetical protein [Aliarcobacter butzleri]MDK2062389.1 hypothetical protein [Aliarcobacter butzleri]MDK2071088.1 hypothetical protein [Aliarcobacter butzleri]MDN5078137.1 hypothetical protein [Aliarcobacter butzleri]MDN5091444.1 hypothetical protein [Aliarcobacter butzleri]MDN5119465.1 hypothetical protein [Aliarcobacter butzleri]